MQRPYDFSFIIPTYNCATWISEAIDSLIGQTIGFQPFVQIIVVDDGSTDDTAAVCRNYTQRYPDSISYIYQDNKGACAARLRGLAEAEGQYIGFLDADDMWSSDICECAQSFFYNHPEVGICTARLEYCGERTGDHALAYKYRHEGVVDLDLTIDHPQLSLSSCIVRRELLDENDFDAKLVISEDFLPINRMLMRARRYGILREPTYHYRKRGGKGGAIDNSTRNPSWYLDTPRLCYQVLFNESKAAHGKVLPFLQYAVMYDLQWRIKDPFDHPLDEGQLDGYREELLDLMRDIDTAIIFAQRNLKREQKVEAAALKFGLGFHQAQHRLRIIQGSVYWVEPGTDRLVLAWQSDAREKMLFVENVAKNGNFLLLKGRLASALPVERLGLSAVSEGALLSPQKAVLSTVEDAPRDGFFEAAYFKPCGFEIEVIDRVPFALTLEIDGLSYEPEVKWASGTEAAQRLCTHSAQRSGSTRIKRALRGILSK